MSKLKFFWTFLFTDLCRGLFMWYQPRCVPNILECQKNRKQITENLVVRKKEEKQTMERYNKAVGRVLRALFMFHGALAEPSWDGKQLDKQRGGEKCQIQIQNTRIRIHKYKYWNTNTQLQSTQLQVHKYSCGSAPPSSWWDGKQLDKQRGGEKCLANSKLETDGYIKQRKTGTNNG